MTDSPHADHPNALRIVDEKGVLSDEMTKLMLEGKLTPKQIEALKDQGLRQETFGIRKA